MLAADALPSRFQSISTKSNARCVWRTTMRRPSIPIPPFSHHHQCCDGFFPWAHLHPPLRPRAARRRHDRRFGRSCRDRIQAPHPALRLPIGAHPQQPAGARRSSPTISTPRHPESRSRFWNARRSVPCALKLRAGFGVSGRTRPAARLPARLCRRPRRPPSSKIPHRRQQRRPLLRRLRNRSSSALQRVLKKALL